MQWQSGCSLQNRVRGVQVVRVRKRIWIARDNLQTVLSRFAGGWMRKPPNEMGSKAVRKMANNRANEVSKAKKAATDNNRDNNKAVSKVPSNEIVRNGLAQIPLDRSAEMIGAITDSCLLKFANAFGKHRIFVNSGVGRQPEARTSSIKSLLD